MIELVTGSIFDSDAECIVNPVNCVGVMGGGLALEFKHRFPEMYQDYKKICTDGILIPGRPYFWESMDDPQTMICLFPTKDHWKNPSTVQMIDEGMKHFHTVVLEEELCHSIAFPMLGSGLGGLNFEHQVLPLFVRHFHDSPLDIRIHIYP